MKKYLLLCTALTISSSAYATIDCSVRPGCDDLGYTQSADDCAGQFVLKCPFDSNLVFCGGDNPAGKCNNEGYNKTSCGTYEKSETCPYDSSLFKCTAMTAKEKCSKDGYTATSCNTGSGYYVTGTCSHDATYVSCAIDTCSTGYVKAKICETRPAIAGTTPIYKIACSNGIKSLNITSDHAGVTCYTCVSSLDTGHYLTQAGFCESGTILSNSVGYTHMIGITHGYDLNI